jgi:hypothetical protein
MRMIPLYLGLCLAALATAGLAFWFGLEIRTAPSREAAIEAHQLLGLSAAVLLLLVQCAVFVYFLGTGKAVKTAVEMRGLDSVLARRTRTLKGKTFPFATFSAVAVVAASVLAGVSSPETHALVMTGALALTVLAIPFELRSIRENMALMNATDSQLTAREEEMVAKGESLADPDAAPFGFVAGRLLALAGASTWLVFAYRALVMRAQPEPWPGYVLVSLALLAAGLPLMRAGRRRDAAPRT